MKKYTIYTDGAHSGKSKRGGYAFVILEDGVKIYEGSGSVPDTTNNRMELMGPIRAAETVRDLCKGPGHAIIVSDSKYVVEGITDWIHSWIRKGWVGWNGQPVKNKDLWETLHRVISAPSNPVSYEFLWTQGHAGNEWNEYCDRLAKTASQTI